MKKNLITIFLLVGAFTLNLSVLCQAGSTGSHRAGQLNADVVAAAKQALGISVTHPKAQDVRKAGESRSHGPADRCAAAADYGIHLDFNLDFAAVEITPQGRSLPTIAAAAPFFTSLGPAPQDRPPKPLA